MTVSEAIGVAPARRLPFFRRGPGHALLALIGWFLAISTATALVMVVLALVASVFIVSVLGERLIAFGTGGIVDLYAPEHSAALVGCTILMMMFQGWAMIWASRRMAGVIGEGDLAAGLGDAPVARPLLIAAMAIGLCLLGAAWGWAFEAPETFLLRLLDETRATANIGYGWFWRFAEIALLVQMVVILPIAEELFFRGWIWTEMRRTWAVPKVMLATAVPFVLVHGLEGSWVALAIVPVTVVLTLARQVGGSVRASMLCHVLYNAGILGTYILTVDPLA